MSLSLIDRYGLIYQFEKMSEQEKMEYLLKEFNKYKKQRQNGKSGETSNERIDWCLTSTISRHKYPERR